MFDLSYSTAGQETPQVRPGAEPVVRKIVAQETRVLPFLPGPAGGSALATHRKGRPAVTPLRRTA